MAPPPGSAADGEPSPIHAEYTRRLAARSERLASQGRLERRLADARLALFVLGIVLAWLVFRSGRLSVGWLAVPAVLFLALVVAHERVRRGVHRASRAVEFYRRGLDRLDGRWAGKGITGERFVEPEHPYAADLDLFGVGSLFERICTARTRAGEDELAAWLLRPATAAEVEARQAAVAELRPRLALREDLELLGSDVREGIDPEALASWGVAPRVFAGRAVPWVAALLALLACSTLLAWALLETGPSPFLATLILEGLFAWWQRARVRGVLAFLESRAHDLVLLSELLQRLEHERFEAPALVRLRAALETDGEPASRQIARLARLLHLRDTQKNQLFAPLAAMLLWTIQLAVAVDRWRARSGPAIARWLAAVGEFEALCALSGYAAENPADPFPEIVGGETCFDAEAIGHPLIPEAVCVRNDLSLGGELRMLTVSGSNMSGKSTLLRTVGANAVLALAGAPVRARRLRISPLAIGATLRVQDSLQAGRSKFFAEITRVKQLVEIAQGPLPLLFLLDELLNGTNSHDRRVGAEAIVRGLIDRGAIGLITTHDLALAEIAEGLAPRAANVHFEDRLEGGTMHFDYRMRPGVVRHSNALALMRAVGLDV